MMQRDLKRTHRHQHSSQRGFTLVELMIAVVVIGILSAIAIPSYDGYVQRARLVEATTNLSAVRNRLERFYQDNRSYLNAGGGCGVAMPVAPDAQYFNYACAGTAQTYRITATGTTNMTGFSYTIDQDNAKTSTTRFKSTSSSGNCWLTREGICP